jgi:hypothetical protein
MHLPLFGQIIAGVIAFIALAIGWDESKQMAEDFVKDTNFPLRWVVSVKRIDDKLSEASYNMVTELKNKMTEADKTAKKRESLPEKIATELEAGLRQRADDQILRFGHCGE